MIFFFSPFIFIFVVTPRLIDPVEAIFSLNSSGSEKKKKEINKKLFQRISKRIEQSTTTIMRLKIEFN